VDGDDRPHPGLPVEAEHHLLVAVLGHPLEDAHIALLRSRSRGAGADPPSAFAGSKAAGRPAVPSRYPSGAATVGPGPGG
jgi:hypothetical protein